MDVSSIDTQDAAEMSEFEGVFSTLRVLFEVAGQAAVDLHPFWRTPQQARYDPGGGEGWQ
jgi:hypothetical protein